MNSIFFIVCAAAIAVLVAAVALVMQLATCTAQQGGSQGEGSADPAAEAAPSEAEIAAAFTLTPQDMQSIPAADALQTFSLSELAAVELSDEQSSAIQEAVDSIEESGDASVVFVDVETGRGIAYSPDTVVYGASSLKGPYAVYVLDLVEDGLLTLDSQCPVSSGTDSSSYYGRGGYSSFAVSELIEASIVYSDNNAFGDLRDAYDSIRWDEWSAALGATDVAWRYDSWYAWYCARSSAELWAEAFRYLESGSENAAWLAGLFESTETSFIRDGLSDAGCTTMTKAGWCAYSDPTWNGVCDAGILEADGHTYIMSIMTGMPDSTANREKVSTLASALFNAREALGLQQ